MPSTLIDLSQGTAFLCLPACKSQCLYSAVNFAWTCSIRVKNQAKGTCNLLPAVGLGLSTYIDLWEWYLFKKDHRVKRPALKSPPPPPETPLNKELLPKPSRAKLHALLPCSQQTPHSAEGTLLSGQLRDLLSHCLLKGVRRGGGEEKGKENGKVD